MANFKDVFVEAIKRDGAKKMFAVNRNLMEVATATKKKPAFVKVAIDDATAREIMNGQKYSSFIICFDGDLLNEIAEGLDNSETDEESA